MNDIVIAPTAGSPLGSVSWPSPARAWYAVGVFAVALLFNYLDRQILALLVGPIKHDLQLTDTEISVLIGFAFVSFYVLVGIPISRLVDTYSRRLIVTVGIASWSVMTALCGMAQNFWQLFVARVGVGVGESCNGPATYSMLSDMFPRERLPQAIAVLNFGFMFGSGLALILGGSVIELVSSRPDVTLPLIGTLRPWQLTFFIVGLPGLLVAALLGTVREPVRRGFATLQAPNQQGRRRALPVREIARFLRDDWKAFGPLFIGTGLKALLAFGTSLWIPTFFIRKFGWSIGEVGWSQGLILLTVAPLGLVCGGALAERLARRGHADANLRVVLIATLAVVPASILFPLMSNAYWALGFIALNTFFGSLGPGPQNAALQTITPNPMRGQVTALYLAVFNLIGFGLGPFVVALLTDHVFGSEAALPYSLAVAAAVLGPVAAFVVWYGMRPYAKSVTRARAWA
jgi:MFS family permease